MFDKIKKYFGFGAPNTLAANDVPPLPKPRDGKSKTLGKERDKTPKGSPRLKNPSRGAIPYKMKFLDKHKKIIIQDIESGFPYAEIARKNRVSIATFDKWRAQNNLKK